jgi:putative copper export protein
MPGMDGAWQLVLFAHVIAMAFFVGGQLAVAAAVAPVLRGDDGRESMRLIGRRFGVGSLIAVAVLLITGIAMAQHLSLWSDATLMVKLCLVAAVGVLMSLHGQYPRVAAIPIAMLALSVGIVWLGLDLAE